MCFVETCQFMKKEKKTTKNKKHNKTKTNIHNIGIFRLKQSGIFSDLDLKKKHLGTPAIGT